MQTPTVALKKAYLFFAFFFLSPFALLAQTAPAVDLKQLDAYYLKQIKRDLHH